MTNAVNLKQNRESDLTTSDIRDIVISTLEDGKAMDVVEIDLEGKTSIADIMVVASGSSSRQVVAMAEHLVTNLKKRGLVPNMEGKEQGDWVLIDAFEVLVHIFRPEVRDFYNLEKMWGAADEVRKQKENAAEDE